MDKHSLAWIAATVVFAVFIYLISPILTPFVAGFIFAYIGNPIVNWVESKGPSRTIAVLIGYCGLLLMTSLILFMLWPIIQDQTTRLLEKAPEYIERIQTWVQSNIGSVVPQTESASPAPGQSKEDIVKVAKDMLPQSSGAVSKTVETITDSGGAILAGIVNLFLIPVIAFYLLRDWQKLSNGVTELMPPAYRSLATDLMTQVNDVLFAFMKGQGLVMICLGAMYSVGLMLIGLQFGLIIGVIALEHFQSMVTAGAVWKHGPLAYVFQLSTFSSRTTLSSKREKYGAVSLTYAFK